MNIDYFMNGYNFQKLAQLGTGGIAPLPTPESLGMMAFNGVVQPPMAKAPSISPLAQAAIGLDVKTDILDQLYRYLWRK